MEININQKKISIANKYQVFIDGNASYTSSSELFRLLPVIKLFKNNQSQPILTIDKKHGFFKAKYDITYPDNTVLEFRTKSFWKKHFECQHGPDHYDIFGHRGRKFSVYKNDQQVAWWDKKKVTWFDGDNYTIVADNDSNYELIIAFCLIIDNYLSNDKGKNSMTIDFGHIGPTARKFDKMWQPNSLSAGLRR